MIIALSGKKRAGKDTVAKIIMYLLYCKITNIQLDWVGFILDCLEDTNLDLSRLESVSGFSKKMFAYKLKKGLEYDFLNEFNIDRWENEGDEYRDGIMPSLGLTRRVALQQRGQKMREINPNYWVNALMNEYKIIGIKQLVSDEYIKMLGERKDDFCPKTDEPIYPNWIITDLRYPNEFEAIRKIEGSLMIRIHRPTLVIPTSDNHESETALDEYDDEWFDYVLINTSIKQLIVCTINILQYHKII